MALALLVLFALRSLVPAGYMPVPAAMADGLIRMTLCDGYTTRSVLVDTEGQIVEESEGEAPDACDFALAGLAATLFPPDLLPLPVPPPRQAAAATPIEGLLGESDGLWLRAAYTFNDFRFDGDAAWGDNALPGAPRHYLRAELLYGGISLRW